MVSVNDSSSSPPQSTEASTEPLFSNQEVSPGLAMISPDSLSPPSPPSLLLIPPLSTGTDCNKGMVLCPPQRSVADISETLAPQETIGGVSMERAPLIITNSLVSVMSPEGTSLLGTDVMEVLPPSVQLQISAPKVNNPSSITSDDETQASEKSVSCSLAVFK